MMSSKILKNSINHIRIKRISKNSIMMMEIKIKVIQCQKLTEVEDVVEGMRIETKTKMINSKEMVDLKEILKMIGIIMSEIKMIIKKMINFLKVRDLIEMQIGVLEILETIVLIGWIELRGLKILVLTIRMKNQLKHNLI